MTRQMLGLTRFKRNGNESSYPNDLFYITPSSDLPEWDPAPHSTD